MASQIQPSNKSNRKTLFKCDLTHTTALASAVKRVQWNYVYESGTYRRRSVTTSLAMRRRLLNYND